METKCVGDNFKMLVTVSAENMNFQKKMCIFYHSNHLTFELNRLSKQNLQICWIRLVYRPLKWIGNKSQIQIFEFQNRNGFSEQDVESYSDKGQPPLSRSLRLKLSELILWLSRLYVINLRYWELSLSNSKWIIYQYTSFDGKFNADFEFENKI